MLVFFFRKRNPALAVRRLKDLRNPHFTALWQATDADVKALEVLTNAKGRE